MKEYPILFKGDLVRAILEDRKTQTRRISDCRNNKWRVGDRLWGRENFRCYEDDELLDCIQFQADMAKMKPVFDTDHASCNKAFKFSVRCEESGKKGKWKPSIHMPREASRILLEITDIREEYLQDITEEDARAEGIIPSNYQVGYIPAFLKAPYSYCFAILWDTCSPDGFKWVDNPKIKRIAFKRVNP